MTDPAPRRTLAALGATVVALAAFNVVRSTVLPDGWDLAANVAMAGVVALLALWAALTADELGLQRSGVRPGLTWGAAAFGLVLAVLVVAALVPATRGMFDDDRAEIGLLQFVGEIGISVPFGTVLLEELAFRGSILGLLRRRVRTWVAVVVSSVLFGCWHIAPAITSAGANDAVAGAGISVTGNVIGTVLATFVAGLVFCWLRLRSTSLLAPMLAHLGTNSIAFTIAWILAH